MESWRFLENEVVWKRTLMTSKFFLVLVMSFAIVMVTIISFAYMTPSPPPRIENRANLRPHHLKRIKLLVERLKKETLGDSLKILTFDMDAFGDPGFKRSAGDKLDVVFLTMLSNRRSVKLMQDLQLLKEEDRIKILSSAFNQMLRDQKMVVYSMIAHPNPEKANGRYYATKYGITWALFASAEFANAKELGRQLDELERLRQEITEEYEKKGGKEKYALRYFVTDPFPDDVAVLNAMLHHILKKGNDAKALASLNRCYLPLIKYDAPANTFDVYISPTDEPRLPSWLERKDVWRGISIFKWEYELSGPENIDAIRNDKAKPSYGHQKKRLEYVRSLLSNLTP